VIVRKKSIRILFPRPLAGEGEGEGKVTKATLTSILSLQRRARRFLEALAVLFSLEMFAFASYD